MVDTDGPPLLTHGCLYVSFRAQVKSLVAENAGTTLGYEAAVCGGAYQPLLP